MSDFYTWPQKCPDLVQDVSLKRARIDNEDGTSTIRTTSSSSTDVTAITQALGNQADTSSQPSVIGLLKNLIANSGGGEGESTTYPVFKSKIYNIDRLYRLDTVIPLSDILPSGDTVPEWTKYIIFWPLNSATYGTSKINGPFIVAKQTPTSLVFNQTYITVTNGECSVRTIDYFFSYLLQDNTTPAIRFDNGITSYFSYPESDTATNVEGRCTSGMIQAAVPLAIIFLDSDPLEIIGGGGGSGQAVNTYSLTINGILAEAIDSPVNTPPSSDDKTLATLGSFQKRYKSWYSSIVFTPDTPKTAADLPSGFQTAIYQATEAEFTGTYFGVQVCAKFKLSPNSDEIIVTNPVVCYNTNSGEYSHTRGFLLKLQKSSSEVILTMEQATSIDFGNNDNTFNSYVDSTTTFNVSYIKLKMTNF